MQKEFKVGDDVYHIGGQKHGCHGTITRIQRAGCYDVHWHYIDKVIDYPGSFLVAVNPRINLESHAEYYQAITGE
jgi:hypothetical protein